MKHSAFSLVTISLLIGACGEIPSFEGSSPKAKTVEAAGSKAPAQTQEDKKVISSDWSVADDSSHSAGTTSQIASTYPQLQPPMPMSQEQESLIIVFTDTPNFPYDEERPKGHPHHHHHDQKAKLHQEPAGPILTSAENLLKCMDNDKNGTIDSIEHAAVQKSPTAYKACVKDAELSQMSEIEFKCFDTNKDGNLSLDEIKTAEAKSQAVTACLKANYQSYVSGRTYVIQQVEID